MLEADGYLVDVLLPKHEVHLLAGPSGAGKTRWLLNQLLLWERGERFLGFNVHPTPWAYVAGDRSFSSLRHTLNDMYITFNDIPNKIPAWEKDMNAFAILDAIQALKGHHLVVWEAFGSFVEAPQMNTQVKAWLSRISKFCRTHDKTIIGVVESPKMKPYERYNNPRQRVSGVAAWSHFVENIFLVENEDYEKTDNPERILWACGRNSPLLKYRLCFDLQNRLLPVEDDPEIAVTESRKRLGASA